jgi:hypothetical protein
MAWNVSLKMGGAHRQVTTYSAAQTAIVSNSRHLAPVSGEAICRILLPNRVLSSAWLRSKLNAQEESDFISGDE